METRRLIDRRDGEYVTEAMVLTMRESEREGERQGEGGVHVLAACMLRAMHLNAAIVCVCDLCVCEYVHVHVYMCVCVHLE